ncbi:MAG TPA: lytic transglycosylase domain-containing protein [Candidatus Polarisedimenticolia bacterium]|nr:lytic transglycosylase domain-containing protein [Candidatus Polarisedimenticolia bacterium]
MTIRSFFPLLGFPLLAVLLFVAWAAPARADTLTAGDKAIYRAAFKAVEQDKWADARRLAGQAKNKLPGKVIQWLDLTRPGRGRSFDEITQFQRDNPGWPYQNTLQAMAERNMPPDLNAQATIAWFHGRDPQTAYGAAALARALLAGGQKDQAASFLRQAWRDENFDSPDDEATFLAEFSSYLRPDDHVARLDRLLWSHDDQGAGRVLAYVDSGHQALAIARIALAKKDDSAAIAVGNVPPPLQHDAGLLYELARNRRKAGDYIGAAAVLDPPPPAISRPDLMWPELEDAARRAVLRGDMSVGYRLASGHQATDGVTFADGEWLSGWIALRFLDDFRQSYTHFTGLYTGVSSAISKARGAYWAGRAAEEMGDMATAQNWYRAAASNLSTYYGQLAASRVGSRDVLQFGPMPQPSKAERLAFESRELVRVVRLLAQLDQSDRARPFLQKMTDETDEPTTLRMIADLGPGIGREDYAVMVAKAAHTKGVEMIDYLFPLRAIPKGQGPEPALLLAVIRQESAFDVKAVSSAGALGLMQLMPFTAKHVAKTLKTKYRPKDLVKDGDYNIRLGRAYLQELLEFFDQSYVLAVAAYNAGPDRVNQWIQAFGDPRDYGVDVVDWVETIPLSETRNYVQRVMENLEVYRHRLGTSQMVQSLEQDLTRRGPQ